MRARAVVAGAATLLLLSGCSAFPNGFPSGSPSPSGSTSASPVPLGAAFGDVAPRESVTDELGTYLHVTLSPASAAATAVDPATVDSSITGSSWDDASLLEAQRYVATFVAEQTIDSIALDRNEAGWDEWVQVYLGGTIPPDLIKPDNGADRPVPIYNDPDNLTPQLVRDGLPRLDDASITVESLVNSPREGGEWLTVSGVSDVAYRLSDEGAIASLLQLGYDEDTATSFPALTDGTDGHYLTHFDWSYSVERVGDAWQIRDYDLVWDSIIEGVSQA
jgi:hypothetical protein